MLILDTCPDIEVCLNIENKLYNLIKDNKELMEQYLEVFLPRFLKLAKFKPDLVSVFYYTLFLNVLNTFFFQKIRVISLKCLQLYVYNFPLYKLIPHKQNVTNCLMECLDDHKRIVRQQAVETRSAWILLDAPM